ncbi:NTPase KAP family P-loop domain-containing protein 1 [Pygocentrus nattereri]|uniref:NTPase KAP family P-loop domain-containing protein 1 n=1 Tax=Pygocentrus nattereri TaxID=42514 RepID=UPI0018915329|nr:NTPase KAP family P-loop domain-containing protein 1 [Pygocentrus nattereri]
MIMAKDLYSENVYAYALAKTLAKVHPPMTVGLYSSCHSRIKMILKNIEGHMNDEAKRRESKCVKTSKPRPMKASIGNLLSLITHLVFYRPVWTEENQSRECVRYVFVKFSAWHFAGSDMLWAGLVMHLCQTLQDSFGKLQLSLFRVAQYDVEKYSKRRKTEDSSENWRPKMVLCCPLWAIILMSLIGSLFILVPLIIYGFPQQKIASEGDKDGSGNSGYGVLEGLAIAALGVPAAGAVRFTVMLGKNLIFNQDLNVRRSLDNKQVSEQLGLMHEVRKEMRLLSCFVHFMEIFERRKIKVVLEITNLDRCTPEKIVGVLDAINILLSDEESPFISLIAIDPEVLTQQVDQAKGCFTKKDRAYSFLDRIITLPFTIPPLCEVSKCKVFRKIVCGQPEISNSQFDEVDKFCESETSISVEDNSSITSSLIQGKATTKTQNAEKYGFQNYVFDENEVERLIQSAFESIFLCNQSSLHTYVSDNTVSMRRVINSIRVTIMVMEAFKIEVPPPERVAAWVVLVDRWPCRLSWILQCVEDEEQNLKINENETGTPADSNHDKTLWNVFSEHRVELHVIGDEVEKFLERDDDPELFEMFLKKDFKFTVGEMAMFKSHTVNLDCSIKNELARIRGNKRVKGTGRSFYNTLSPKSVINMSEEDVCNELSKLKLPEKYNQLVRENHINGQTLLLSDPADLRQVMQMTLGEWTTFRIHFLGVMSFGCQSQTRSAPVNSKPNVVICPSGLKHDHMT